MVKGIAVCGLAMSSISYAATSVNAVHNVVEESVWSIDYVDSGNTNAGQQDVSQPSGKLVVTLESGSPAIPSIHLPEGVRKGFDSQFESTESGVKYLGVIKRYAQPYCVGETDSHLKIGGSSDGDCQKESQVNEKREVSLYPVNRMLPAARELISL
ncbi:hypothetical protein ACLB1M_23585 [Escherichia coli]